MLIKTTDNEFVNTDCIVAAEKHDAHGLFVVLTLLPKINGMLLEYKYLDEDATRVWEALERVSEIEQHPFMQVCCLDKPITMPTVGRLIRENGVVQSDAG